MKKINSKISNYFPRPNKKFTDEYREFNDSSNTNLTENHKIRRSARQARKKFTEDDRNSEKFITKKKTHRNNQITKKKTQIKNFQKKVKFN